MLDQAPRVDWRRRAVQPGESRAAVMKSFISSSVLVLLYEHGTHAVDVQQPLNPAQQVS